MEREDKIVANLLTIGTYLINGGNKILAEYGLNQQQFVVLRVICRTASVNQREVCSSLLFEKSHVSKIVKKLQSLDYISISRSATDNRVTMLTATQKGKEIVLKGMETFKAGNKNWLSGLSETESLHTELVLDKLVRLVK